MPSSSASSRSESPGRVRTEPEERRLVRRHAERLGLAPQVAGEPEDRGPELVGDLERRTRSLTNHSWS